jgi:ABC-type branched-subunit amino acid transport system substrate-binding protein
MLLILSLALVLSSCQVATPQPEEAAEPEVETERNVAEIIAAQLEESGGIVGPDGVKHEVEVLIGDTETNPDVAVSVARRYIDEDEVVAVVAGSVTPISLAVAAVAEEAEVPYISMASSLAIVTDPDTGEMRPWVFKVQGGAVERRRSGLAGGAGDGAGVDVGVLSVREHGLWEGLLQ